MSENNFKNLNQRIRESFENATFCYASKEGQGFTSKTECECYSKGQKCCNAFKEHEAFHALYKKLEEKGHTRDEILDEFKRTHTTEHWYQYNVIE
jgi:hypothetical protein